MPHTKNLNLAALQDFIQHVQEGIDQVDRGERISEEEMKAVFGKWRKKIKSRISHEREL